MAMGASAQARMMGFGGGRGRGGPRAPDYSEMFGQMQEQSRTAEAASQAKYQEMLGVAGETTGQRQADIRQDYASRAADITQQQSRLGMSGTTVGTSLRGGVEREKQSSLNRLADTMQQTKLGIMGQQAAVGERFAGQRSAMMGQRMELGSKAASLRSAEYQTTLSTAAARSKEKGRMALLGRYGISQPGARGLG